MPTTIASFNANAFPNRSARAQKMFRMSDGTLVAVWWDGDVSRWRRAKSTDNGSSWSQVDPSTALTKTELLLCFNGDVIYGMQTDSSSADMVKWVFAAGAFTDTKTTYTPTNSWNSRNVASGEARFDTVKSVAHISFVASPDAGATEYRYLVAISTAPAKLAEFRFSIATGITESIGGLCVDDAATPNVFPYYLLSNTSIGVRRYTFNGSTYTLADAEETAVSGAVVLKSLSGALDQNDKLDLFWVDDDGALKTRKRTAAATYSAVTTLDAGPLHEASDDVVVCEHGGANADLSVIYAAQTGPRIYQVRRTAGTWGAAAAVRDDSGSYKYPSTIKNIGADSKVHIWYQSGFSPSYIVYDVAPKGTAPSAPTNVVPSGTGNTDLTPLISATYVQTQAGLKATKYRVLVKRQSDATVFWDTGSSGTALASEIAPGGTFSIEYAGTALVVGTTYTVEVKFWEATESLEGSFNTPVAFQVNLPPNYASAVPVSNSSLGKTKVAVRPLYASVGGPSSVAPDKYEIWRRESGGPWVKRVSATALAKATISNSGSRELPLRSLARNFVTNGAAANAYAWILHAQVSAVEDASSPTGYAFRHLITAGSQTSMSYHMACRARDAYSFAAQARSDGTAAAIVEVEWLDAGANVISTTSVGSTTSTAWTELATSNVTAPGNARLCRLKFRSSASSGIYLVTALRMFEQSAAAAAWASAHQTWLTFGTSVYEGATNLAADGDMEAAGVTSYAATDATLTKDTGTRFSGAQALKVTNTAANGRASQTGALAAGTAITASVRCKGGDAGAGIRIVSTPGGSTIGTALVSQTTDWEVVTVSGTIAGGDTGWRVDLIGGSGTTTASFFDLLWIDDAAYDTGNADPTSLRFALSSRTADTLTIPTPGGFSVGSFAVAGVYRPDHPSSSHDRVIWALEIGANDRIEVRVTGGSLRLRRTRAGVNTDVTDAFAFAAGDTIAWAIRASNSGLTLMRSLNGAAVTTTSVTTEEAKIVLSGTVTQIVLGRASTNGGANAWMNGTLGLLRFLAGTLTDAQLDDYVLDPYKDPSDDDVAVWTFNGGIRAQVPVWDDRLIKLGTKYEYRAETIFDTTTTRQTGEALAATTAEDDRWWLRDETDSTKDLQVPVIEEFPYEVPRGTFIAEPLSGGNKISVQADTPFGIEGRLRVMFTSTADAKEAALRRILATTNAMWLQDPFGGLRKIVSSGPRLNRHDVVLEAEFDVVEVV